MNAASIYLFFILTFSFVSCALLNPSKGRELATHSTAKSRICAVGDIGSGDEHQREVSLAMTSFGCTHILLLGDNFYKRGVEDIHDKKWRTHFEEPYAELLSAGTHFFVSLGNHDYLKNPEAEIEYSKINSKWILPHRYHGFNIDHHCFFAIDSNRFEAEQIQWLKESLENRECLSKTVFGHHPLMSSGIHEGVSEEYACNLQPLLAPVDLFLSGHDHNFSDEGDVPINDLRTQQKHRNKKLTAAERKKFSSTTFRQLVIGTGGAHLRDIQCTTPDCRFAMKTHGFLYLNYRADTIQFHFMDTQLKTLYSAEIQTKISY